MVQSTFFIPFSPIFAKTSTLSPSFPWFTPHFPPFFEVNPPPSNRRSPPRRWWAARTAPRSTTPGVRRSGPRPLRPWPQWAHPGWASRLRGLESMGKTAGFWCHEKSAKGLEMMGLTWFNPWKMMSWLWKHGWNMGSWPTKISFETTKRLAKGLDMIRLSDRNWWVNYGTNGESSIEHWQISSKTWVNKETYIGNGGLSTDNWDGAGENCGFKQP